MRFLAQAVETGAEGSRGGEGSRARQSSPKGRDKGPRRGAPRHSTAALALKLGAPGRMGGHDLLHFRETGPKETTPACQPPASRQVSLRCFRKRLEGTGCYKTWPHTDPGLQQVRAAQATPGTLLGPDTCPGRGVVSLQQLLGTEARGC